METQLKLIPASEHPHRSYHTQIDLSIRPALYILV